MFPFLSRFPTGAALLALGAVAPAQEPLPTLGGWVADRAPVREPLGVAFRPDGGLAVVSRTDGVVLLFDAEGARTGRIGAGLLHRPTAVEVDGEGRILVCDTGHHRVVELAADGSVARVLGGRGAGPGSFFAPVALDLSPDGELLAVADSGNDRVQVLDRQGAVVALLTEGLRAPTAVALGEDEVLVADSMDHRVEVFDLEGRPLRSFGDWGFFPGLFARIGDLELVDGVLLACDAENHRVQAFTPDGELLQRFGLHAIRPGEGRGKLHYPSALAVAPGGGRVALAEPLDDRVQILGPQGELDPVDAMRLANTQPSAHYGERLSAAGNHLVVVEPETHELLVFDTQWQEPRLIARLGGYGDALGLFNRPVDAVLDDTRAEEGVLELFVADAGSRSLHHARLLIDPEQEVRFDPEMARWVKRLDLVRLGTRLGELELERPVDPVAVELAGEELLVLDGRGECVHVFGRDLRYRRTLGEPGTFWQPSDLAFDRERGTVWVVDRGHREVVGLGLAGEVRHVLGEDLLRDPFGVVVDGEGALWVSDDGGEPRVWRLTLPDGEARSFGSAGLGRVQFSRPRGLDLDRAGQVVVLDHGNHRIQWLTTDGEYAGIFGSRLYTRPARLPGAPMPWDEEGDER